MAVQTTVIVNGVVADVEVFNFDPGAYGRAPDIYPKVKSIIYSGDAAALVHVFFAPAAASALVDQYDVINDTLTQAVRGCFPVWLTSAPAPFTLRITRGVAVNSTIRIEWEPT